MATRKARLVAAGAETTTRDVRWLVRSNRFPDAVVPAQNEEHALELVRQFRRMTVEFRQRVPWEYGVHIIGEPDSYRRVGP